MNNGCYVINGVVVVVRGFVEAPNFGKEVLDLIRAVKNCAHTGIKKMDF